MPDFKKMTLESLRALARKALGPGHSKKSKSELVAALEAAGAGRAAPARGPRAGTPDQGARAPAKGPGSPVRAAGGKPGKAAAAGKAAPRGGRQAARAGGEKARAAAPASQAAGRRPAKVAKTVKVKGSTAVKPRVKPVSRPAEGPDPEGYFVARVRGEDAMRDSPHPMAEAAGEGWTEGEERTGAPVYEEHLGDLPWGYGDDAFVALPRDPRTLFLYWDWSQETLTRGFEGFDRPRTQLWIFALGEGDAWGRVRVLEFALEARGFYVHDLDPGRTYRAEIHVVDRAGRERLLASPSNPCALPPSGPSPLLDDRFIRIPWDLALGQLLGPGHTGGPFGDDVRAQLARLSDWSRFSGPTWGGSAGGMGGRPFSPSSAPSSPPAPSGRGEE